MTNKPVKYTVHVEVYDEIKLYEAALECAINILDMTRDEAHDSLMSSGRVAVRSCVHVLAYSSLIFKGCAIVYSAATFMRDADYDALDEVDGLRRFSRFISINKG